MAVFGKITILVLVLIEDILGANILYVAPIPSPSHHIWNKALAIGLVKKGYNVTMLGFETEKLPLPENFTLITMEGIYDKLYDTFVMEELADESVTDMIMSIYDYGFFACRHGYNTTGLQVLLNYPSDYKFDLIIFDATIGRCFYPLIERFNNPPAVATTAFLLPPVLGNTFGKHYYTSYMPFHSTTFSNDMNLGERTLNFVYTYFDFLYWKYIFSPKEDALIRKRFGEQSMSVDELERNISLVLCNTDPILEYPEALPPNIIPVGGLHARPSSDLPRDLQKILDEAKDGVILFSLGTNVRSDQLDLSVRKALLDAFSKFPQVILWKFETDVLDNLPKNVVIRKWLPQNDILGHPNVKIFINHGGALSTQEAIYHGVPVIGIPFFADQHLNVRKMEKKGIAKRLNKEELTFGNIYNVINEVLTSPKYRTNMQRLMRIYRDQPQTALERAIFWIEHLLRHGSAKHLVSSSRYIPVYQSTNLDVVLVFAFGLVLVYSFLLFTYTLCRFIITAQRSSSSTPKSTK